MAKDADQIVVGANGSIYVAPPGTTLPADEGAVLNAAFKELGYASEDGVTLSDGKEVNNIDVWQSFYAARRIITAREFTVAFVLRQWSIDTVEFAFGGTVSDIGGGSYKFTPPEPQDLDERSLVIDWQDGDKDYRLVVPKGIVTEDVESQLGRANAADLPITFGVLGVEGDDPWYIFTNDPAWSS